MDNRSSGGFSGTDEENPVRKIPKSGDDILTGRHPGPQFSLRPSDNRYPGVPDGPQTWEGWKEPGESLAKSTMRDEIRLTRAIAQYRVI
ncbi:MAG: hypothetical protein Q4C47_09635 [Planctomycetia bacterium]|nr:hypothetical protein [Planctomycetia bacterium]